MKLSDKIKAIRIAEGLSQNQLCELIGLPRSTLSKYESGLFEPGGNALLKYTKHPLFSKYTMWLMTDTTNPEVGQIEPAFSLDGSVKSKTKRKVQSFLTEGKNC
ncbi:helix-turn-helix transcriptional regulator (plasmid) [Arsenophonus nasoniae]|uniref:Helix-turn-helix transcriptional regulator n=1 Tax=Arsenophonus nasoniae TaxID=638 RepID=A0ABY8NWD0_9GAMM|nr:helix-turn-helix transcriptional regulator [Arsenophonus nasoniae]WGM08256.1 helix-turn-helix transcriptional regulator [Arsenophonus nasoniae]WGM13110.1 helix-turn-helix transcriptional regulator [Arsenophonus nasoniae]WGM17683.1 helix-turn-helix transcriptional regulator [Arsenophonus nasoniae]